MVLKSVKSVCNYVENNGDIICAFNGKKLDALEEILSIAKSKFPKLSDVDFFEFGSQEWNPSHFGPRSGMKAHFMGVGTDLSYRCFDAYSGCVDFDVNLELIKAYKKADKEEDKYLGLIIKFDDFEFYNAKKKFESLGENKDLSQVFVRVRNEEYFKKFYEFYDGVDLVELKNEIRNFSVDDYGVMKEQIKESKSPLIYSSNVLNSPNLTYKYNFWNIDGAFHIHSGNIDELAEIVGINLGLEFRFSDGKKFDAREEFVDSVSRKFCLLDYDVNLKNDSFRYFLFWNS